MLSMYCRYKSRLYSDLGPNLWIIKMRAPLSTIEGEAASYATGTLFVLVYAHSLQLANKYCIFSGSHSVLMWQNARPRC